MTAVIFQTEALVLHSVNFKEHDKIVTLFSQDYGVIKLFVKIWARNAIKTQVLCSPLTVGEYLYQAGRGDFVYFKDGSILEQHYHLRQSLASLEAAQKMLYLVLKSQLPGKPAIQLYAMLKALLKGLTIGQPNNLVAAFVIKLLKHEGLLAFLRCSICQKSLQHTHRLGGECFCSEHAPSDAQIFSQEEEYLIQMISESRSIEQLCDLEIPCDLSTRLESLSRIF